jgi:hypothetical protein
MLQMLNWVYKSTFYSIVLVDIDDGTLTEPNNLKMYNEKIVFTSLE